MLRWQITMPLCRRLLRLCCIAVFTFFLPSGDAQPAYGITREVYANIPGSSIPELTNNPAFPNNPTLETVLTNSFDCPVDFLENYGTRLRALIIPPTTGAYTFWIASDDQSVLYLSTDASPSSKQLIARVNTWTAWKEWTKEANQQSAPISLVGGQSYYIEALQKEGGGGDSLSVRWRLPSGAIEEPIPATRCLPVGVTPPVFLQHPASVSVTEGSHTLLSVRITRSFGAVLQWQRAGTNIPGANTTNLVLGPVALADHGSAFRCIAVNPYGSVTSFVAMLSVSPDNTAPTLASVGNLGDDQIVTVVFSEAIAASSATASANYGINNGVLVLGAQLGPDNRTVVLTTTPMAMNGTYILTVNNVRDLAATPNVIAPNTQRSFTLATRPLNLAFVLPNAEPPGPATRRGPLVISEVMYHPTNRTDLRNVEFIEIYNSNPWFEEMGGFRISGEVDYTFPSNYVLQARSYVVVAAVPADVQSVYGVAGVQGPWVGSLQNGTGNLRLHNAAGAVVFEMEYSGDPPFPASTDGAGHSLVLARPSYGASDARAWAASDLTRGTPGTTEVAGVNAQRSVMINEFLAHTDVPSLDYIELFNYSSQSVNLAGCVLTDDPLTNKFVMPAGTLIPANGFLVFYETNLNFALRSGGETIYFKNASNTRVLDAVRFEGQENGVATGRSPDGASGFVRLQSTTPGTNNARPRPPVIVINEIMYDPLSDDDNDEFIELHNPGTNAVNVSKWRLADAVKFTLPNNTIIPPNGYLVIGANDGRLRRSYPNLNSANCLGDWEGSLRNSGERIALTMPDQVLSTNELGGLVTNTIHIVVDEVSYRDGGRWGRWSGRGGSSLELRDARSDRRLAPNWADSDESSKSGWVNIEATGVMDNGYENATQLHITLMGAGEALIDNVELYSPNYGNVNLIGNGTFDSDINGWVFQGNHNATTWETTQGYGGGRSLHLRATGRGDTGANRVRTQLPFTLANGSTLTLRAKVRWLKGNPNILLRIRGNYFELPGFMLAAKNLGTPGERNRMAQANIGPAITDVAHWPTMPAANQPVLVTARAFDPDGIATMLLNYRLDPSTNLMVLAMTNNGAGIFSAVIPAQPAAALAGFYVQAADKLSPATGTTFPNDAPLRECLVRWGDPAAPANNYLGSYRFWISQANLDRWTSEEKMSNKPKDVTFLYGTNRVIYNAGAWFHGSPYHSPSYNSPLANSCDYDMGFPSDEKLLGETDINLFRPGNGGGDGTAQAEIQAYWFGGQFGVPFLYHRPVFVYANGQLRALYHDAQQPNGDFVEQWYPDDSEGELHKIQLGFEFGDTAYGAGEAGYTATGANLARYTTTGGAFKMARYRQTWPLRSVSPTQQNDYTNLYALVNATLTSAPINTEPYTATLTRFIDVREWYKVHVTQHLYNNPDSYSYGGGQNAFAYKPLSDTWKLLLWDVDFAFGGTPTDPNLFGIGGADHGPRNDHAPFARIYWQTLIEAANGFMTAARSNPILDARYSGMVAGGATISSPQAIKDFIAQRRSYILTQIAANNTSPFDIQSNGGVDFTTGNNLVTLTGRAPFDVASIEVNGVAYPVTWTSLNSWSIRVALPSGTNGLNVVGFDQFGRAVSGSVDTISVNVSALPAPPQEFIVINEIMFHPRVAGAEYLELFNTSSNFSFDLSGWRVDGINYSFPEGTVMLPRTFLLLIKDAAAFANAYGNGVLPFGVFEGNLQANGETISVVKPGLTAATDIIVDRVRYEGVPGWSTNASGTGSSLQLVDARQDNSRAGNWFSQFRAPVFSPEVITPRRTNDGWRFFSVNGTTASGAAQRLILFLGETGSALIDDLSIVLGTNAAVGSNYVRNGDFESPLLDEPTVTNSWFLGTNYTDSHITGDLVHGGSGALKIVGTTPGFVANPFNRVLYQFVDGLPRATNATLSFWYWATNSATNLYMRVLNSAGLATTPGNGPTNINVFITPSNYVPPSVVTPGINTLTPGLANAGTSGLPAFPTLWINEVQAENFSGILDSAGQRDPWIEIYNGGTNTVTLTNLFLSHAYSNLTNWAFPAGTSLGAGEFLIVFCDAELAQTTANELHSSFRLPPGSGSVVMSRLVGGQSQVVDYVNYTAGLDHSYGSFPDGQPFTRQEFYFVTPGVTNNGTLPAVVVSINEWMADNIGAVVDPADNNYEDWFELYNPGSNAVSLAGYYLTATLTNQFKFEIPSGYTIPPRGYLLVWADGEPAQNSLGNGDLHVNFKLAKSGEAIGLFTPDGIQIDAVTFDAQTSDVSMGRFPDGSASIQFLTNVTPRAANTVPQVNVAPVLAFVADKVVAENELLLFTTPASDSNVPAQPLTWSLAAGAPAGASIGSTNGVFNWRPGETDGGSQFPITVIVADNGAPSLSATQRFIVTVFKTNDAPALMQTADKFVAQGDVLTFVMTATDPDIPAQQLTFSLDPDGLPAGAAIDATNGIFTWTPDESYVPGVYDVRVRVTDNGAPPRSDVFGVAIHVTLASTPTAPTARIALANHVVTLNWNAMSGRTYRVEMKSDLSEAIWTPLFTNVVAGGTSATVTDPVGTNRQRIYRIVLLP